ncbi:hypothetical protein I6A60_38605 [Frankia sp. AgB1.9]|uniref:hypothetical protein n=1 Tax=unclassified Frankia TaxID=2632575 RepID=UPI00193151EB|nr:MULTISPECIES: hypothetical protein [unclassified Frankia]MBL7491172.1 hypothetical protein [Frankia sp. AgW1.1]MBL7553701.1 hypothetical protein [Frankia sp. AgB1.9]MBL7618409.1 hypothetical protein [Frankia sp. AgB1.8]
MHSQPPPAHPALPMLIGDELPTSGGNPSWTRRLAGRLRAAVAEAVALIIVPVVVVSLLVVAFVAVTVVVLLAPDA